MHARGLTMNKFQQRLDGMGRRHPAWMIAALLLLTVLATILLLTTSEGAVVLYQAF